MNVAKSLEDRLWQLVKKGDECWEWIGCKFDGGYGRIVNRGKFLKAHRVAYELKNGPVPEGLVLDHLCRNRLCVNPDHLEPVTPVVNTLRGGNKRKTHCMHGHPFEGDNLIVASNGHRRCRKCQDMHVQNYRDRCRNAK